MLDFSKVQRNTALQVAKGLKNESKTFSIDLDDPTLSNSHILVSGGSGTGKTTLLRQIIDYLEKSNKTIIVIDFHGDMHIEGENLIELTPSNSPYAINPFELELDPKKGGVTIQADAITIMLASYFFDKGRMTQKQKIC